MNPPAPRRAPSYFLVAGVALDREMDRLRGLPVFAGGPLAVRPPELKVRRARRRPNRVGFAVPTQFRLSVTAYPGIRPGDVLETLLHELTHLHVGRAAEAHAWHGRTFKATLARAMQEAYEVDAAPPAHTRHGVYAEAIERAIQLTERPGLSWLYVEGVFGNSTAGSRRPRPRGGKPRRRCSSR